MAKKKEDAGNEKKRPREKGQEGRESREQPDNDAKENQESHSELTEPRKLLKCSTDTDIYASQLRLRDAPFEIIKEKFLQY